MWYWSISVIAGSRWGRARTGPPSPSPWRSSAPTTISSAWNSSRSWRQSFLAFRTLWSGNAWNRYFPFSIILGLLKIEATFRNCLENRDKTWVFRSTWAFFLLQYILSFFSCLYILYLELTRICHPVRRLHTWIWFGSSSWHLSFVHFYLGLQLPAHMCGQVMRCSQNYATNLTFRVSTFVSVFICLSY